MILVGFSKTVTIAIHDKYACKKKYIYELAKEPNTMEQNFLYFS